MTPKKNNQLIVQKDKHKVNAQGDAPDVHKVMHLHYGVHLFKFIVVIALFAWAAKQGQEPSIATYLIALLWKWVT